ncbi:MAG: dicarboxylate/amino acid:cation symporter [Methylococcaceae bacterium]|nr:dicarboxylate/amino acid:cation symporter [Methylococcaceae bacterium]MDP3020700.1 dicarboxylate/amino acid:cation symporter [Methylococcaceae bacterium]MDP3390447.1 dicarboxylate/amino acid:cation symporter [Methylococcaceae bacterium]MDP3932993.1 dicarboxylate/amino acid:cation symporter [Methylococcaceae bacterium]MDZ4157421.1 dicarboxylate/amino acid:cation symporter [Methylococcales bacterium]
MTAPVHPVANASNRQTLYVALALVLGILVGELLNLSFANTPLLKQLIEIFAVLTDIFLRLVKMIIAPLVFSTLVVGMAKMGDIQTVGRIGTKAILWFFSASLFSLLLGMLLVNTFQPGSSLHMALPAVGTDIGLPQVKPTLASFAAHMFPKSIVEAMANNEILQIVVFAMFFGVACASLGDLARPTVKLLDSLSHIMLKVTSYVMHYAPVAVFSAIASVIAQNGISVLLSYGKFIGQFYFGLVLLCLALGCFACLFIGRRIFSLLRHIREPMLLAFGTASSESAYPKLLQQLERFGCDEKVCGLVLPLGYSFNLDGSMMYMTFAVLFIAQAYGIDMPLMDQLIMLLVLLFTSKGVAGVPRASLIVIAATLSMFHIPEAGLLLLLGIDQILDMGRSATNVFGNSIAATLVSRWEKALR